MNNSEPSLINNSSHNSKFVWLKHLQPDLILGGSILSLTPQILAEHQLQGLILDVDDTLVPFKRSFASGELIEWVTQIRQTADIWLVSNNLHQNRISTIADSLNLPYLHGAGKPSRRKLRQALTAMNLPAHQVAMVGDRLFTDVIAGNRLGLFTIWVEPIMAKQFTTPSLRNLEVWLSLSLGVTLHSPHKT
ncbi:MAG: YqeG family HAD IIIA-type phosphatase [Coleofasciculaceae cyanobacterium SM2_1_6]|nr:YqeG family HAD IIIA-type phosphatase [Coleofasciculaceae cyanobacterium SM2_1_6]